MADTLEKERYKDEGDDDRDDVEKDEVVADVIHCAVSKAVD